MYPSRDTHYTYILLDPRKPGKFCYHGIPASFYFEPFYVGKGKGSRWTDHVYDSSFAVQKSKKANTIKFNKICHILTEVRSSPFVVIFVIGTTVEASKEAFLLEKIYINSIGRINTKTGPLANLVDGGKGPGNILAGYTIEQRQRYAEMRRNYLKQNPQIVKQWSDKGVQTAKARKGKSNVELYGKEKAEKIIQKHLETLEKNKAGKVKIITKIPLEILKQVTAELFAKRQYIVASVKQKGRKKVRNRT